MDQGTAAEYRLSHGQKALWFLHALAPESGAYHVLGLVRVREILAPAAVEHSFLRLVRRHAALRSTFEATDGDPRTRVQSEASLDFVAEDAAGWSPEQLGRRLREETYRPFDLAHGPLLRVRLLHVAGGSTVLLVVVHHIVADFWSFGVLMRELGEVYREETGGEAATLPPLPRTFADFVAREAEELAGPAGERLWSYWRERLAGPLPALEIAADRPRPAVQTFAGAVRSLRLDPELTGRIRSLGRAHKAPLFPALLAGFQALLHRLTGQEDLLVGSPAAGRPSREWADLVGYFVNPVVIRGNLSGDPPFSHLLEQAREEAASAFEHQAFPFSLLTERLQPARDPSRSPIFQVMFALQKVPVIGDSDVAGFALGEEGSCLKLGGLAFESVPFDYRTAQFDLTLLAAQGAGRSLWLSCQYNTDLFDAPTVERLLGCFEHLLRGVVAEPSLRIADLPLLGETGIHQILCGWNDTGTTGEPELLHARFERRAADHPDAVALIDGGRCLTYGELALRAARLARFLRTIGVGPEIPVGLCMDRSLEMVAGMLGILLAGGAYVPLDPEYPAERRAFLAEDAGVPVVLTRSALRSRVPDGPFRIVELDGEEAWDEAAPMQRPAVLPGNLAYLIYTSGSTGRPKGIGIEHRSASALVRWAGDLFADADLAAVLASTSINFDLSVFELFVTLSRGGAVVLVANALAMPRHLPAGAGVTLINTVPSALAELLRGGPLPPTVRTVNLAGEPLRRSLVDEAYASGHVERVFNLYGPSEDTTYSTWELVPPGETGAPTLGRPIRGTRAYVLDQGLRPVPPGAAGEICLAGEGLARGYAGRAEMTAERFVPDPFGGAGERLYRTGDLARQRPDGRLELLGRIDHQVKVRGFRIELGEIEDVLDRHPGLREAVVVAAPDASGYRTLVAYVVPARPEGPATGELRAFLRERLPEPMIPSLFIQLPDLPRTPNGKVDRRGLPAPNILRAASGGEKAAPRTPTEELLAGIWAEVLGCEQVGIDESFFDLGGHSLTAARVSSRVGRALGRDVPLREILRAPTVADLAVWVDRTLREEAGAEAPPLARADRGADLPASFGQERLWFLHRLHPASSAYHMPAAVRLRGSLRITALEAALGALTARHEALRTGLAEGDRGLIQRISPPMPFLLSRVDLGGLPEARQEEAARHAVAAEGLRPFDLETGPLIRAVLIRRQEEDYELALTLHHAAGDGWSLDILALELSALYGAAAAGRPADLPELTVQYADFAAWQRSWLQGEALERRLGAWRRRLAGLRAVELPADRPRTATRSRRAGHLPVALDEELARRLRELSRRGGATLFMTLLTGVQILLSRLSGQEDLAVGTPVAGRDRAELEGVIGFFVNTLVVRGDLSGDPGFGGLLERTREATLAAFAGQEVPFEAVSSVLEAGSEPGRSAVLRAIFALQGTPPRLALPGLDTELREAPTGEAKFDLTLVLADRDGVLAGWIEHDRDLFDPATVARWSGHLETLLRGIAAAPETRISELPLLSPAELAQVLVEWNATRTAYPADRCVHELFAEQAARTPEAVAVEGWDGQLTYGALADRAGRLAGYLREMGVGPETRVGLLLERSVEAVVAIVGVLAAGGAYLPLDPSDPPERLRLLVQDTGTALVLSRVGLAERLPAGGPPVVLLDREAGPIAGQRPELPASGAGPDNLVYILFTSGSQGRPKGVGAVHRGVVRLVRETGYARFGPQETWLQLAPLAFDASTLEIWGALLHGGRLVVAPPGPLSLAELGDWIAARGVTSLWLTAGLFQQMVDGNLAALRGVRQLLTGGDVVSPAHARRLLEEIPGCTLFDGYGPTENTTFTCCWPLHGPEEVGATIPVGRPIANTRVYVLDRGGSPVPSGVGGELCTGGDGLARGYWNRPDLTAERFVPDPFGEPGARLYRTGDLSRLRPDGVVEFLGRLDDQVKLRGFRIELGEIEAALVACPGVEEAVVVAWEAAPGDKRLAAFVTGAALPSAAELRASLAARLPDFMIPARFASLPTLPLTFNGKVDRRALVRRAEEAEPMETAGYVAPRGLVEELVAAAWSEVLGLAGSGRALGASDDFFELGGHSLLATRVVSRLRELFAIELPLVRLFDDPTVAGLARAVEELRAAGSRPEAPPLRAVPRDGFGLPPSFAQERLWFLDQLHPGSTSYSIPAVLRLAGRLDPAALHAALNGIVRRHEALRTTFERGPDGPRQIVAAESAQELPVVDLAALPVVCREAEARRLASAEAVRPFDLARGPLLRTLLLRRRGGEHDLVVNLHHIVADGWSVGVLLREIEAFYGATLAGCPAAMSPLPFQYADYAAWQRSWLASGALDGQLAGWRERLAGASGSLELPTDRPRPAFQGLRGGRHGLELSPDLSAGLAELGLRKGATRFMVLLAGFAAFLHRISHQDDLAIGSPVAGRRQTETEGLIGLFVNTLVLRIDAAGEPDGAALLARVRETALDAFARQDLPFERLVGALAPGRELSRPPLFQVFFTLQNAADLDLSLPGLVAEPVAVENGTAKFDLTLSFEERGGVFAGWLEYDRDLFDAATVTRWAGHLTLLLGALAAEPERRTTDLPLLAPAERSQVLQEWGAVPGEVLAGACLHELFTLQATRTPGAEALVHGRERWSYSELAARAGGLARRLREMGAGPEVRIAVCLERSPDLVAALLGVLAAGGAYVPIDPSYPTERRTLMLEDSSAAILVTRGRLAASLPVIGARLLDLDAEEILASCGLPEATEVTPANLAYVIYTSGSTGRPKGVAIEHRSAAALAGWAREVFSAEDLSGILASTSVCFDLSVFEIFAPLCWGGRVILAENALDLPALPASAEVRLVNTVPSAAAELVRSGGLPPSVRTVCLAGEPLPAALAARLYATGTVLEVLNLYGPSEDTTYSTGSRVPRDGERMPAIGRPLPATRAVVVDRRGELVPPGVAGELWLAGAGLARGYLGRPDLTAERFSPDPFGGPGERVYRTGDLVRFRADGELEFHGRIDHQVKVRGFRIELGEIEAALAALPGIEEGAVMVEEPAPGDRRLVAFVTGSAVPSSSRAALAGRLPEYMVPGRFVALPTLPRTPNGKVDRRELLRLAAETGAATAGEGWVAPRGVVEELIAGVWAEVLDCERVGGTDDFFALGGHSLLATRVMSRLRDLFGVELPVRRLFEAPTVAGLAGIVGGAGKPRSAVSPITPTRVSRDRELPLSFAQERLWLLDQLYPRDPLYNLPFAVRMTGRLDAAVLHAALSEIVCRHEALRTTFRQGAESPCQVIAADLALELPVVDLSALSAAAREGVARSLTSEEARRPFDLTLGPLFRAILLRLDGEVHHLAFNLHHIVVDGWSLGVLVRELAALYEAFAAGRSSPLSALPLQYADFAVWQRAHLSGAVLDDQLAWWRQRLAGAPFTLELPTDRPHPAVQGVRGRQSRFILPAELSADLARLSRTRGTTLFMTLLSGLGALLGRISRQPDLLVGSPVAHRNRVETEDLIGFFVNTLVLRIDLAGGPSFGGLLERVREMAFGAYAHQDVPFEKLVEALATERELSRAPLFQVLFALQNAPLGSFSLPGLAAEPLDLETGTSKFDLAVFVQERGGRLVGWIEHRTDLFDASTIARFQGQLERLLRAAARSPETPVADLPLLDPTEQHQLLVEWNDAPAGYSDETCAHDLFSAQVAEAPDEVAVQFGDERLTYRELAVRAGHLARQLRALGIGPGDRVGLVARRSLDLFVGVLGTLEAGAAYVPLDPVYPPARLAGMVEDARIRALLTPSPGEALPGWDGPEIRLDEIAQDRDGDFGAPAVRPAADDLAYVIYTSGSTGRPKGVAMSHRALVHLIRWQINRLGFQPGARTLQFTSLSFDVSFQEMFVTWASGGTLVLIEDDLRRDAAALLARLESDRIERLFLPFVALQGLAECLGGRPAPRGLREVITAGEQLKITPALAALFAALPGATLENQYGPSETHVVTSWTLPGPSGAWEAVPPIGRPVAGNGIWLLDPALEPVPIGVPGELYAGGPCLARGYLGRPDLTAERFVPHPAGRAPGERLYRTGDLARYRADGSIEFLGRADDQVKVRGYRVEPGEIETALSGHPRLRETVVGVRPDPTGEKRIVAWIVAAGETAPDVEELRSWLRGKLPDYMIPGAFVPLKALPLTPSGKVDRRALPAPDPARSERTYVAPRTATEKELARTWAELLGLEKVGIEDNFFHLGGHSLRATQILSRVRDTFGVELPLRSFFAQPRISDLALVIDERRSGETHRVPDRIRALPRGAGLPGGRSAGPRKLAPLSSPVPTEVNPPSDLRRPE